MRMVAKSKCAGWPNGMRAYTDKQIVEILKVIEDGAPVVETLREKGVSKDTYYKWKQKFNGMQSSDIKKLRELEKENAKLKKMYADMALANEALKDVIEKKL
jgi:putative transposase